jgi:hypothetical protein
MAQVWALWQNDLKRRPLNNAIGQLWERSIGERNAIAFMFEKWRNVPDSEEEFLATLSSPNQVCCV